MPELKIGEPEPIRPSMPLVMIADRLQAHTLGNPLTNKECWDLIRTIQPCARSYDALVDALRATITLFEAWRDGIFFKVGVIWIEEPPAIIQARAALAAEEVK